MSTQTEIQIPEEVLDEIVDFLVNTKPKDERIFITVLENEKGLQTFTKDWNAKVIVRRLAKLGDGREIVAISVLRFNDKEQTSGEITIRDERGYVWFRADMY